MARAIRYVSMKHTMWSCCTFLKYTMNIKYIVDVRSVFFFAIAVISLAVIFKTLK